MSTPNQCGECTECCTVFGVPTLNKKPGQACSRCTGKSCGEYDTRPGECMRYQCTYKLSNWPVSYRPDKCGVLIDQAKDGSFEAIFLKDLNDIDQGIFDIIKIIKQQTGHGVRIIDVRSL